MKREDQGLYVLVLELKKSQRIKIAKLSETYFRSGSYLYLGRAKRGLKKRVERHLRKDKKLFWHIDYFLQRAEVMDVWIKVNFFDECLIAKQIRKFLKNSDIPQKKFGASDCHCPSHLLHLPDVDGLQILWKKLGFVRSETYGI